MPKSLFEQVQAEQVCCKGMLVRLQKMPKQRCLELRTVVFSEKDFVPLIIRSAVRELAQKQKSFELVVKEDLFAVEFVQKLDADLKIPLAKLIRLFVFSARSWAVTLKRLAEKDLKPVSF